MRQGIHQFSHDVYISDPCDEPSLSASGITLITRHSPAFFAANHPRLSRWPSLLKRTTDFADFGSVTHALILGQGALYEECDPTHYKTAKGEQAKDFRAKEAQQAWDAIVASGRIPIVPKDLLVAQEAAQYATEALLAEFGEPWTRGLSEMTYLCQRDTENGRIWLRAMIDRDLTDELDLIVDIKTTKLSITDFDVTKAAKAKGWAIQAFTHKRVVEYVKPEKQGEIQFVDFVQQTVPPFDNCFFHPLERRDWREAAANDFNRGCNLFAACIKAGEWPGRERVAKATSSPYEFSSFEELEPEAEEVLR